LWLLPAALLAAAAANREPAPAAEVAYLPAAWAVAAVAVVVVVAVVEVVVVERVQSA